MPFSLTETSHSLHIAKLVEPWWSKLTVKYCGMANTDSKRYLLCNKHNLCLMLGHHSIGATGRASDAVNCGEHSANQCHVTDWTPYAPFYTQQAAMQISS